MTSRVYSYIGVGTMHADRSSGGLEPPLFLDYSLTYHYILMVCNVCMEAPFTKSSSYTYELPSHHRQSL